MNLGRQRTSKFCAYDREIELDQLDIRLDDIVRALPKINRFNGQTSVPYSVAMHSLMCKTVAFEVHDIRKPHELLAILLHDAAEAYIGDIVRPLKAQFGQGFFALEDDILAELFSEILLFTPSEIADIYHPDFIVLLDTIDTRMGVTECDALTEIKILPDVERYPSNYVQKTNSWKTDQTWFKLELKNLLRIRRRKLNESQ
jgi:5'-deoxynucleotidase YfbR-like HD superfamily hydrolase